MKPAKFPRWVVEGRPPPRWPDILIQVLLIVEFLLLLLFC
jgi:hypothetical protein